MNDQKWPRAAEPVDKVRSSERDSRGTKYNAALAARLTRVNADTYRMSYSDESKRGSSS